MPLSVRPVATDPAGVAAATEFHHAGYFALEPDTAQSHSLAIQLYPSSPWSRSSTPCNDLAEFDSENSYAAMSGSPLYIHYIICQSKDYVYELMTLVCLPGLV